jgi:hypothetical protein
MNLFNKAYKSFLEEVDNYDKLVHTKIINDVPKPTEVSNDEEDSSLPTKEEVEGMIIMIKRHLFTASPYFWHMLKSMPIRIVAPDSDIQTAAVDQYRNLYFNPKFIRDILEGQEDQGGTGYDAFTFLVAHEVYHVVNRTFERQQDRTMIIVDGGGGKHSLWNIATDFEMNDQLKWKWNIQPPMINGREVGLTTNKDGIANFAGRDYVIRSKSAEMIYAEIARNIPKINIYDGDSDDDDDGGGDPEGGDGESGKSRPLRVGDIAKQKGKDVFGEIVDIKDGEAVIKQISKEEAYRKINK